MPRFPPGQTGAVHSVRVIGLNGVMHREHLEEFLVPGKYDLNIRVLKNYLYGRARGTTVQIIHDIALHLRGKEEEHVQTEVCVCVTISV